MRWRKQIRSMSDLLLKEHTPKNQNLLKLYSISESEIIKGTRCPRCSALSVDRINGKWIGHKCGCTSKKSHLESLQDYTLLFTPHYNQSAVP